MIAAAALLLSSLTVISGITSEDCQSYDSSLFPQAKKIASSIDDELVPSKFAKVIDGIMFTVVDEEAGEEAGGGTNTDGSYQTFLFSGDDALPAGYCDVPDSGGNPRCDSSNNNATISFSLGPADVISVVSCTPPPMAYYSYDTIVDVRFADTEYPFLPGQPFGDDISHLSIEVQNKSNVFDQPVVILQSSDNAAIKMVTASIQNSSLSSDLPVSVRQLSSSSVYYWKRDEDGNKPDILSMVSRMAYPFPDYRDAYEKYKLLAWPVKLYMAANDKAALDPLEPDLKPRYSDNLFDEKNLLTSSMRSLKNAVIESFLGYDSETVYTGTQTVNLTEEGYYDDWNVVFDRQDNSSFAVPTRDATYGLPICASDGACRVEKNTAAVVIGVLHADTQNAAYNSVGVSILNTITQQYLETHWIVDTDLRGSAARYIPDDSNSELLFAVDLMPPGLCSTTPYPQWCVEMDAASSQVLFPYFILGERIYALSDTTVGPPANTTIGAELVVFRL